MRFSNDLHRLVRWPVVMLMVQIVLEHLQLLDPGHGHLVLVRHERAIKVERKRDKHDQHRDEDDAGGPGGGRVEVVKLDPAQDGNLQQEQNQPEQRRKGPRRLDVPVEALVRGLVDEGDAVQIAHGFDVRQDARADHEGEHVDGDEERRADGERNQHGRRDVRLLVQLDLHHGDHGKSGQQRRRLAGRLQLGPTQLQLPPGQVVGRVVLIALLGHCAERGTSLIVRAANTGPVPGHRRRLLQAGSDGVVQRTVARRGMTVTVVAAGAVTAPGDSAGTRRHRGQVVPAAEQVLMAVVQGRGSVEIVVAGDEVVMVQVLGLKLMAVVGGSVGDLRYDQRASAAR